MGAPVTAPTGNVEKSTPIGQIRAMPVSHGTKSRPVSPTGSEKVGPLFGALCKLVKNLKICPSPTLGDKGVKFVRPLGDLNAPKEKIFWGPRVKFGELEGFKRFSPHPAP